MGVHNPAEQVLVILVFATEVPQHAVFYVVNIFDIEMIVEGLKFLRAENVIL